MALNFDGVDDKSEHRDINALDGTATLSTSLWVNIDVADSNDGFWSKGETFGVGISGNTTNDWQGHGALASAQRWRTTDSSLVTGVWAHVGALYDGNAGSDATRFRLLINGVQKSLTFNAAVPTTLASTTTVVTTGQNVTNTGWMDGRVAHLKIWNTLLSATELIREMTSYYPIRRNGLVLWAPYDDGIRARDYSGSENHGTVAGALFAGGPPHIPLGERSFALRKRRGPLGLWGHRVVP